MSLFSPKLSEKDLLTLLGSVKIRSAIVHIIQDATGQYCQRPKACDETTLYAKDPAPAPTGNRDGLSEARKLYEAYNNLPDDLKENMSSVINCSNFNTFLISGCLSENVLYIWDRCRLMACSNDEHLATMICIFHLFVDMIQRAGTGPHYRIISPKIGEQFNERECQPDKSSAAGGVIKKVLLPGITYTNANTKTLRKAYVHVEQE